MNTPTFQPQEEDKVSLWFGLSLVWEIGYIIAIPAFVFGFGGAYMDKHYDMSPIYMLLGLLLALLISSLVIYRKVKALIK